MDLDRTRDPQKNYQWEVGVLGLEGAGDLKFFALRTSVPMKSIEHQKMHVAGVKYGVPLRDNSPSVFTITFWDNEGGEVYELFKKWFESVSKNGKKAPPRKYMRKMITRLLAADGQTVSRQFEFEDAYPIEIGEVSLTYSESNATEFDVKFFYHRSK